MNSLVMVIFSAVICVGIFLCFIRMIKGPTVSDRAVAMDTITTTVVALLVLSGFIFRRFVYLDVALVYSLLSFVGLVAIARYLEGGI